VSAKDLMAKRPIALVEKAVRGMLPKNRLGDAIYRNLHVYTGVEHPHSAQQPKEFNINTIK
jgi:large subunit ribosomal protein L13